MQHTTTAPPPVATSGPALAQTNPLAFVGAAFAAGMLARMLTSGVVAIVRATRRGRTS